MYKIMGISAKHDINPNIVVLEEEVGAAPASSLVYQDFGVYAGESWMKARNKFSYPEGFYWRASKINCVY